MQKTPKVYVILGIAFLVFLRVASFEVSELDDHKHLFENPVMKAPSFAGLFSIWSAPYFSMYIPVTYTVWLALSFLSNLFFGGLHPSLFHLANACLHTANALLVFQLLRRLARSENAALAGALFFLLHPLQAQPVGWISAMKDLLGTHWALWGLMALPNKKKGALLYALSCLSKPSFVILPVFAKILFPERLSWKQAFFPLAFLALPLTLLQKSLQPDSAVAALVHPASRPLVALDAIGFYALKILMPHPLLFDYARRPDLLAESPDLGVLAIGLLALGLLLSKKTRTPALLFLLAVSPVLGWIPFQFQKFSTVADHYLYFALFGLAVGLSTIPFKPRLAGALLAGLALLQVQQLRLWKSSIELLEHNARFRPQSFLAHNNLGTALYGRRRFAEAARHFHLARQHPLADPDLILNEGASLFAAGERERAIELMRESVRLNPHSKIARANLERALEQMKEMN